MRSLLQSFLGLAVAASLLPALATAAEERVPPLEASVSATQVVPSPAPAIWGNGSLVGESELSQQRGGADLHLNENNARAIVTDNVAANLTTGNNSINGESFSGMSGVPMVVQNSGNNVVIQNSTILNLQLQ